MSLLRRAFRRAARRTTITIPREIVLQDLSGVEKSKRLLEDIFTAMTRRDRVFESIRSEISRAMAKHGDLFIANLPDTTSLELIDVLMHAESAARRECEEAPSKLSVLTEEVGEVAKALRMVRYVDTPSTRRNLRAELVQVAAMSVAWLETLEEVPA